MGTLAVLRGAVPAALTLSSAASRRNAQKGRSAATFGYRAGREVSQNQRLSVSGLLAVRQRCKAGSACLG